MLNYVDLSDLLPEEKSMNPFDSYIDTLQEEGSIPISINELKSFVEYALTKNIIISSGAFIYQASAITKITLYL